MKSEIAAVLSMFLLCETVSAEDGRYQKMKVELVFFESCPNSSKAAIELESALEELSIDAKIVMLNREMEGVAEHAQLYGSPSILVNEKDLFGAAPSKYSSCRLYGRLGYPTKEEIVERLKKMAANKAVDSIDAEVPFKSP